MDDKIRPPKFGEIFSYVQVLQQSFTDHMDKNNFNKKCLETVNDISVPSFVLKKLDEMNHGTILINDVSHYDSIDIYEKLDFEQRNDDLYNSKEVAFMSKQECNLILKIEKLQDTLYTKRNDIIYEIINSISRLTCKEFIPTNAEKKNHIKYFVSSLIVHTSFLFRLFIFDDTTVSCPLKLIKKEDNNKWADALNIINHTDNCMISCRIRKDKKSCDSYAHLTKSHDKYHDIIKKFIDIVEKIMIEGK